MVLILFVQVLKKVLKSLKFELKYPGGTLCQHSSSQVSKPTALEKHMKLYVRC